MSGPSASLNGNGKVVPQNRFGACVDANVFHRIEVCVVSIDILDFSDLETHFVKKVSVNNLADNLLEQR